MVLKNTFIAITCACSWDCSGALEPMTPIVPSSSSASIFPGQCSRRSGSGLRRDSSCCGGGERRSRERGRAGRRRADRRAQAPHAKPTHRRSARRGAAGARQKPRLHAEKPRAAVRTKLAHRRGIHSTPRRSIRGFRSGPAGPAASATGSAVAKSRQSSQATPSYPFRESHTRRKTFGLESN